MKRTNPDLASTKSLALRAVTFKCSKESTYIRILHGAFVELLPLDASLAGLFLHE
jgi:hypothetical protein